MSLGIEEGFWEGFPVCDVSYSGNVLRMFVIQNGDLGYYVVSRNGEIGKIGSDYREESDAGVATPSPESAVFLLLLNKGFQFSSIELSESASNWD